MEGTFTAQSCLSPCAVMQQSWLPQGICGCLKSPWGKETFVALPWSDPQQLLWGILDMYQLNCGASPCCSVKADLAQKGGQDLVSAITKTTPLTGMTCPLPCQLLFRLILSPSPSNPLHWANFGQLIFSRLPVFLGSTPAGLQHEGCFVIAVKQPLLV